MLQQFLQRVGLVLKIHILASISHCITEYTSREPLGCMHFMVYKLCRYCTYVLTVSSDFGSADFTVVIDNDNPSVNLSIPITDDSLLEGNETFFLTLTAVSSTLVRINNVISPDHAEIVIQDNDG